MQCVSENKIMSCSNVSQTYGPPSLVIPDRISDKYHGRFNINLKKNTTLHVLLNHKIGKNSHAKLLYQYYNPLIVVTKVVKK